MLHMLCYDYGNFVYSSAYLLNMHIQRFGGYLDLLFTVWGNKVCKCKGQVDQTIVSTVPHFQNCGVYKHTNVVQKNVCLFFKSAKVTEESA